MRSKAVTFVAIVVVTLSVGVVSAQSSDPINFRTPFAFAIGDQVVPAGVYRVSVVSPTGTLSFRSEDGKYSVLVSSVPVETLNASEQFKFLFHRYGTHYYLSEIWTPGYRTGRTIQPRAGELEWARVGEPQHVTLYLDKVGE